MLNVIMQVYLWLLIIVCLFTGGTMTALIGHKKRHKENAEATEKWIETIQTGFWAFVLVMGLIGLILFLTVFHMWL